MNSKTTSFGQVFIGTKEEIFQKSLNSISNLNASNPSLGLSGGSTPKAFYKWCVENKNTVLPIIQNCIWSTSDERCVPPQSEESNFGNLDRMLLTPLNLDNKKPWPTELKPQATAKRFNQDWTDAFGPNKAFDICFLGMGEDCHTASLFPNCPLIGNSSQIFEATQWPSKGWRMTITEEGFKHCEKIIITVLGSGKAKALKEIFEGNFDPKTKPAQLLKQFKDKVDWFLDTDAASELTLS